MHETWLMNLDSPNVTVMFLFQLNKQQEDRCCHLVDTTGLLYLFFFFSRIFLTANKQFFFFLVYPLLAASQ
jgi:hypothetical protein